VSIQEGRKVCFSRSLVCLLKVFGSYDEHQTKIISFTYYRASLAVDREMAFAIYLKHVRSASRSTFFVSDPYNLDN